MFLFYKKNTRIKIVSNGIVFIYPWIVRSIESQLLDVYLVFFSVQYILYEVRSNE